MAGKSSKSQRVNFWLPNETIAKINRALEHPANQNTSIGSYCKMAVIRYAARHESSNKRKRYSRKKLINIFKQVLELTQDPTIKKMLSEAIENES